LIIIFPKARAEYEFIFAFGFRIIFFFLVIIHQSITNIMTLKKSDDDEISMIIEKLKPYASKITFGTVVGYCSGAAAKKIGKLIAVLTGVAFIFIQTGKF
jgi:hypothetical protein